MPITVEKNVHKSTCQTCDWPDIDDVRAVRFAPPGGRSGGAVVHMCERCRAEAGLTLDRPDGCSCAGHRHAGGVGGCYVGGCRCLWRD